MNGPFGASPPRQARTIIADPPGGTYRNLAVDNNSGSPNSKIDISATAIVVEDALFNTYIARNVAVTADSAVVGAGGVESGTTISGAMWVARHIVADPWTGQVRALLSTSATAPILPAGFTFSAFTGWHRTSGGNFHGIRQRGRQAQYVVGLAQTAALPIIASGTVGTFSLTSPTLVATDVSSTVPTTASAIKLVIAHFWKNLTQSNMLVAPSQSYSGANNGPSGSTGMIWPNVVSQGAAAYANYPFEMALEATTVSVASSSAGGALACLGWTEA